MNIVTLNISLIISNQKFSKLIMKYTFGNIMDMDKYRSTKSHERDRGNYIYSQLSSPLSLPSCSCTRSNCPSNNVLRQSTTKEISASIYRKSYFQSIFAWQIMWIFNKKEEKKRKKIERSLMHRKSIIMY